ncbi:MAG: ABC transporter ATP-binding protein [Clostridiales bacterium]|nr:ABC transporter ATP-binding protein [Clostridiales bacterium]HCH68638.1 peptide ABC transporter ATP-binding protein [Clostridiales bacterium]
MPILEAKDLIKLYVQADSKLYAVNRVDFSVEDGEFIAIIGASGSGKSTLLQILAGLDRPTSGTVKIRSNDITKMNADELSRFRGRFVGFVFQKHNLIPQFTALENILVPTVMCNREELRYEEHLKKLIDALQLSDRLNHLPSEMSGGQQQRVAIARALINRPQVLFADEPTGNLDRENADEVLELLLETRKTIGQTIVMVTHDISIAEKADKIYKMDDGKLYLFRDGDGNYRRNSYEEAAKMSRAISGKENAVQ